MAEGNGSSRDNGIASEVRIRLCAKRAGCVENEHHEGPCVEVARPPYDMSDRSKRPAWDQKTRDPLGWRQNNKPKKRPTR